MSTFYERNIWAFTLLLKNQPDLFSEQDRADLNDLEKVLTKDLEQISDAIEKWQEFHPEILKAQKKCLEELGEGKSGTCSRGGTGGQSAPPSPSEAELRQQLTNIIRRNKPATPQPKPKSDEKSK